MTLSGIMSFQCLSPYPSPHRDESFIDIDKISRVILSVAKDLKIRDSSDFVLRMTLSGIMSFQCLSPYPSPHRGESFIDIDKISRVILSVAKDLNVRGYSGKLSVNPHPAQCATLPLGEGNNTLSHVRRWVLICVLGLWIYLLFASARIFSTNSCFSDVEYSSLHLFSK